MSLADVGEKWADLGPIWFVSAAGLYVLLRLLLPLIRRAAKRSVIEWDDVLADRKVQNRISLMGPAVLIHVGALRMEGDITAVDWSRRLSASLLIFVAALLVSRVLAAANDVYERRVISQEHPIEPYVQLTQIVVFFIAFLLFGAALADRSPLWFLGGLGAITAVLFFVFRDTVLSFIASVQLLQSDMVDVGDTIEVPSYDVDGDVIDVNLHSVTVRSFDGSITLIPTHRMMTDPFRNWQKLADTGRRRIKRCVHLDQSTIRFLDDEEVADFARFEPLMEYMRHKREQLASENGLFAPASSDELIDDPRRLTNIGTLRAYIERYLERLDTIDTDSHTYVVRQLQPGAEGLPLEVYAFAKARSFPEFERIQADVFDHILAMIPVFGLQIFQDRGGPSTPMARIAIPTEGELRPNDTTAKP